MIEMGGFKDKDLIQDDCGKTKHRQYGQHKRPPRMQQRKNQRQRYLNKEEKRDMSAQELDFKLDDNGQVYVEQEPENQVLTFKDIVEIPSDVQDIKNYHDFKNDFNVQLEQSVNEIGNGFDIQVNQEQPKQDVVFDLSDVYVPQNKQQADVSNDDIILSEDEQQKEQTDPFADIFNSKSENEDTQEIPEQKQSDVEIEQDNTQTTTQESNDSIDQYLKMEIDDSKLSEQNKQKLDAFTDQQMDAFKKFLYQKKNGEQE